MDEQTARAGEKWVLDPRISMEARIQRWAIHTILLQRNISWNHLAAALGGISRSRVGQLLAKIGYSEVAEKRIDAAITSITRERHAQGCGCSDEACAVYSTLKRVDPRLLKVKKGAMEQWREATRLAAS
jgi:hypothetical protein